MRACGARPSRGVSRGEMAFRWKAPKRRERWFSRRDALCASVNTSPTQARARHRDPRVNEGPVAKRWQCCAWRDAFIVGVRSPPLRGEGKPGTDGLGRTCSGEGMPPPRNHSLILPGFPPRGPRSFSPQPTSSPWACRAGEPMPQRPSRSLSSLLRDVLHRPGPSPL